MSVGLKRVSFNETRTCIFLRSCRLTEALIDFDKCLQTLETSVTKSESSLDHLKIKTEFTILTRLTGSQHRLKRAPKCNESTSTFSACKSSYIPTPFQFCLEITKACQGLRRRLHNLPRSHNLARVNPWLGSIAGA